MTIIGTAKVALFGVGDKVRLKNDLTVTSGQGGREFFSKGSHAEVAGVKSTDQGIDLELYFESGRTVDVWEGDVERVRTQTDVLEDILAALQEIAEGLKPKETKVYTSAAPYIKVADNVDAVEIAKISLNDINWQLGYGTPKQEKTRTKPAKDLKTGEIVRLNEKWELVSKVLPLAHGDVWVYNIEDTVIARVKADREVEIKVTP